MRCSFHFSHTNLQQAPPAHKKTTTHICIFLSLVCARCRVDVRAHIHPSTHIASSTFIYKATAATASREYMYNRNRINKSACGVLAQINTLFSLPFGEPININRIYGIQKRIEHWNAFFVCICVVCACWQMDLNQISFSIIKNNKKPFDLWLSRWCLFFFTSRSEAPINNAIRPVPHGAFYIYNIIYFVLCAYSTALMLINIKNILMPMHERI